MVLPAVRQQGRAEGVLVGLAGGRVGQGVGDGVGVGRVEVSEGAGDFAGQPGKVGGAGRVLGDQDDVHSLLAVVAGQADGGGVFDGGLFGEEVVEQAGVEVVGGAARHDDVPGPADDVQVAVLVLAGDVSAAVPALAVEYLGGAFRVVPVALHDHAAAYVQLAGLPV